MTEHVYCNVNAKVNKCDICYESAYFSLRVPQWHHKTYPDMSLLRCGHGMCEICLDKHTRKNGFSCPMCRAQSVGILKTFGSSEIRGNMDSFAQFTHEWRSNLERALTSGHQFAVLYRQICNDYKLLKDKKKLNKIKDEKALEKRKETIRRAKSRINAVCPHCNKNTFTSEKQRDYHISKKHKNI